MVFILSKLIKEFTENKQNLLGGEQTEKDWILKKKNFSKKCKLTLLINYLPPNSTRRCILHGLMIAWYNQN